MGQGVAGKVMSHACRFCGKTEGDIPFKQCSGCKAVRYCNIRHFVKLCQLWQTKIVEKTGSDRRHLSVIYRRAHMQE